MLWFVVGLVAGVAATVLAAWPSVRRALQRERRAQQRARTAERMAELGAMTGGLAHEIRNPLSTIGLNAELLAEAVRDLQAPTDDKSRLERRIGALRRETERLKGILEDFLRFAGNIRLETIPCDVNELIGELTDFFHPQAEQSGVRLRFDPAPAAPVTSVDPGLLKQAILNLLLNAVQAMAAGDTPSRELMVRVAPAADDERHPVIEITVTDTGPGMNADTLAKVFTPYFTTKSGGTGLGLPTTRRIVEAHGGTIDVHSELGKGTSFRVRLPRVATPSN
ncbi:MAG: two-component sensor histidine kinase [Phycisphaeraceae bacterium]|nr:two-component sensor histidine kinase [Phycisphaeraceae bacterium]